MALNLANANKAEAGVLSLGMPLIQSVSVVRCHAASRITWHSHPFYEILLLSEGATVYEFQGGKTAELSGGQFLVIPPHIVHRGLNDIRKPGSLCGLMIAPTTPNACQFTPFAQDELDWLQQRLLIAALKPLKMTSDLRSDIKRLHAEINFLSLETTQELLRARLMMCQILVEVAAHLDCPAAFAPATLVERAIQFMHENMVEPTSIVELAKFAGCSRARLFEVFKETTGMTPNDYWQRMRVEVARERLLNSSDSITQIAMDCGFNTSQYFCTVFRKHCGVSPRECRNAMLGT